MLPHPGVIVLTFIFEASLIVTACPGSRQRNRFGQIQNDDQGGLKITDHQAMDSLDGLKPEIACNTLKGTT